MMKRFWVFIFLFLTAGFTLAQDMPPLPSDAPAGAVPTKDDSMPALPDSSAPAATNAATPAPAGASDMPVLPDAAGTSSAPAAAGDMPPLPDAGGSTAAAPASAATPSATPAAASGMPPLPDSGTASAPTSTPVASASPVNAAGSPAAKRPKPKAVPKKQPWLESNARPNAIFGGWINAKGGNISSKLGWTSQEVLNALDAKKYKMAGEEGVYEGEQNKGPQYRKFTFNIPKSKDTVIVLLKQVGEKVWLRVGPDEAPAPANHTYAQVAKIAEEGTTVLHILKAKFGARMSPHHMVPSWDARFDHRRETADE